MLAAKTRVKQWLHLMQGVESVTRTPKTATILLPTYSHPQKRLYQVISHLRPLAQSQNPQIGGISPGSVLPSPGRTTIPLAATRGSFRRLGVHAPIQITGAQLRSFGAGTRILSKQPVACFKSATRSNSMALKAAEEHLASLGYYFNEDLQMRQVENDKGFEFRTQAHYEELGDSVAAYIQELMVAKYGMQRVLLPLSRDEAVRVVEEDDEEEEEGVPIFVSKDAQEAKAVLVLVCGSGAVMAGQWARKLCMNDSIHEGSVLPLLVWAAQRGIATVVLNPNFRPDDGPRISAEGHVVQAWDQVVDRLPARHVAMVAHSYGGVCACRLLSVREREVLGRLRCIAFTDSVHGTWGPDILSSTAKRFFVRDCVNWVQSESPLDTLVEAEILPKEDRGPEPEPEPEPETASTAKAEPTGTSVYDEELADAAADVRKAEVGAAAEDLGISEEGSADVSMDDGAGPSGVVGSDDAGQLLDLSDKAGMAAAIEKEQDPGLKAMLRKLAGESAPDDASDAAAGDVSDAAAGPGDAAAERAGRGRGDVGGKAERGSGRKAQKSSGFSWAKLGRNKEYCRCRELSAGVDEHERTTYAALESVGKFLEAKLAAAGAELR